jgi:DNA polymerase III alpha subunit
LSIVHTLLGLKTDFSLGESAIASEDVAAIAKRMGQTHVAVADTMTISGLIDIGKNAAKLGIEAHVGVRLRIVDDITLRKDEGKAQNRGAFYLKAFPKDEEGMRQIYALLSIANDDEHSYYVPRLLLDEVLTKLSPENVTLTTGDSHSLFSRRDYLRLFERVSDRFGSSLFIELVAAPTPYYERANLNALEAATLGGFIEFIVTTPTLCDEGQFERLFLNMAIQNRTDMAKRFTVSDPWYKEFEPHDASGLASLVKATVEGMRCSRPAMSADAFKRALRAGNQAFLDATPYRWKKQPIALPSLAADAPKAVLEACKIGMRDRLTSEVFGFKPSPEQMREDYIPRLKYELDVLTTLGFCDYFLVVADLVRWAKSEGIMVGPGRGSCFLAGTKVLLSSGQYKPIEQIALGDIVISHDGSQNAVERLVQEKSHFLVTLKTDDGREITCTPDHLFFTENRGWVAADELTEEDDLRDIR